VYTATAAVSPRDVTLYEDVDPTLSQSALSSLQGSALRRERPYSWCVAVQGSDLVVLPGSIVAR